MLNNSLTMLYAVPKFTDYELKLAINYVRRFYNGDDAAVLLAALGVDAE